MNDQHRSGSKKRQQTNERDGFVSRSAGVRLQRKRQKWHDAGAGYLYEHPEELILRDMARRALQEQNEPATEEAIRFVTGYLASRVQVTVAAGFAHSKVAEAHADRVHMRMHSEALQRVPGESESLDAEARSASAVTLDNFDPGSNVVPIDLARVWRVLAALPWSTIAQARHLVELRATADELEHVDERIDEEALRMAATPENLRLWITTGRRLACKGNREPSKR
jgi:hypothetical protein